jgi:hypothetical protein
MGVFVADVAEVSLNLLLGLYKFPTHLLPDPIYDNELGIIFSDTVILPFGLIVFLHYANKEHPWRTSLPYAALLISLECIFLIAGYLKYIHWSLLNSALTYVSASYFVARIAPRIAGYDPPVPYPIRLLCFSHMIIMWVGAAFSLPLLKMYQFRPGVFMDIMADCRFTDLLSGDVLSILCIIMIPRMPERLKPVVFIAIACVGVAFAFYAYYGGWLIYHRWNHLFMALRYFVPVFLIALYDRWELSYKADPVKKTLKKA